MPNQAFDIVSHTSLKGKLFHIGIEGKTWKLINSLHRNARSVVKRDGMISDSFEIQQRVRQGGILSTEMYKVFINRLLDRLDVTMMGMQIGGINCVAPTCADDVAIVSSNRSALQTLVNIASDYSSMERYLLQPTKSVILSILAGKDKTSYGTSRVDSKWGANAQSCQLCTWAYSDPRQQKTQQ